MQTFDPNSPLALSLFGTLAICFVLTCALLWLSKNATLKRRLFPYIASSLGALFLSAFMAAGLPLENLYTFGPLVALAVWLNIRAFQFCRACGATVRGGAFISRPKFCSKCGTELKQ